MNSANFPKSDQRLHHVFYHVSFGIIVGTRWRSATTLIEPEQLELRPIHSRHRSVHDCWYGVNKREGFSGILLHQLKHGNVSRAECMKSSSFTRFTCSAANDGFITFKGSRLKRRCQYTVCEPTPEFWANEIKLSFPLSVSWHFSATVWCRLHSCTLNA